MIDYDEVYGVGNYDHHMDMRLDIEDMSYEVSPRNPAYTLWKFVSST